ncbi:MAG TPA: tRNA 2-selenouridine(34) synthase MnmH [Rhodocyclaceae bacterium]|nr:tRNA 2-selenouridine(34) synthase MnmH [Rhodocyclaceae bacterium]
MKSGIATVEDLDAFDEIIDVRSPAEFEEDHIPGAINCPVLDNEQRAEVGTIYKQVSSFEAKKIGAAMVSENIGRHLRERFLDRPRNWNPLVYCWRGGNRSGSLVTVLRAVGWKAAQLEGGYKAYRQRVVAALETLPRQFSYRVLCGPTGSAKTRILQALGDLGEQVLDLETLACHKGSVLGVLPATPQPTQKWFETLILQHLRAFDPARPVYVEAESRKIGRLQVPEALLETFRATGTCLQVEAPLAARVEFLLGDYDYFVADPEWLKRRLEALRGLQSNETLARWNGLIDGGRWTELVGELLEQHYDPLYQRSQNKNFAGYRDPLAFSAARLSAAGIAEVARAIVASGEPIQA